MIELKFQEEITCPFSRLVRFGNMRIYFEEDAVVSSFVPFPFLKLELFKMINTNLFLYSKKMNIHQPWPLGEKLINWSQN